MPLSKEHTPEREAYDSRMERQAKEGAEAWREYVNERLSIPDKIARLRAARLAKQSKNQGGE